MAVDETPKKTGPFRAFRIKGLTLTGPAATGLVYAVGLLLCAVVVAGLGTLAARESADELRERQLPFLETALSLERYVYETVFHVSMFGISGDMASYSGARTLFPSIRIAADRLADQALNVPEWLALARDMETLRDLAEQLNMVVEKKRTLNDELATEQATLRKTADDMAEILLDLQARVASANVGKGRDINLDEKAHLLVLNGFSLAVAEVAGRVLAAGVAKSADDLAKAQAYFTVRWDEARKACVAAAALDPPEGPSAGRSAANPVDDMERLAAAFGDTLSTIRFNLEESARVTEDRTAVTGRLTALTRGIVATVRSDMAAAADRTDTALRGACATLLACALLACILGAGVAVALARSRRP
ncbi:MAG: hypothetical protein LIP28_05890 [Deltaproteobacteria bacterium]|nr:hypothetical protein [Deltaproteobacteria bacterium]